MMGRVIFQTEPQVWVNISQRNHLWLHKIKEEDKDKGDKIIFQ